MARAAFVGDLFKDTICFGNRGEGALRGAGKSVRWISEADFGDELHCTQSNVAEVSWGGPIFNSAMRFGSLNSSSMPRVWTVDFLCGPPIAEASSDAFGVQPLDLLREVGVRPRIAFDSSRTGSTIVSVCSETKSIKDIAVFEKSSVGNLFVDVNENLIVGYASDLSAISNRERTIGGDQLGVLLGDREALSKDQQQSLKDLIGRFARCYAFGDERQFRSWGLFSDCGVLVAAMDDRRTFEAVITNGDEPVRIIDSRGHKELVPIRRLEPQGSDLGVGDSFVAGYLFKRALGRDVEESIDCGVAAAASVLSVKSSIGVARPVAPREQYGRLIARSSQSRGDEEIGRLVRQAPGLVIISGGQTGIDELAIKQACRLGLPAFCIMPKNYRTESDSGAVSAETRMPGACLVELGSMSFRYRTWANVLFSDGTLIWDFSKSEGSIETAAACDALNRPHLNVADICELHRRVKVQSWLREHPIRVLNIAGNRRSLLSVQSERRAAREIHEVLIDAIGASPCASTDIGWEDGRGAEHMCLGETSDESRINVGLPLGGKREELFRRFLKDVFACGDDQALVVECSLDPIRFVFMRSKDLCRAMRGGHLDVIVVGSDALTSPNDFAFAKRTGLFACAFVTVGKNGERCCSQYPKQYESLRGKPLPESNTIDGSAEAWLNLDVFDKAVDTWRTGRTARRHGLKLLEHHGNHSLAVVARKRARMGEWIWDLLQGWLSDGRNFCG